MNISWMVARRFLLGGKGGGPSRLTGWIAIVGLAIGCMAMVLSISVLNGFESRVVNKIVGFEGDIRISNVSNWNEAKVNIESVDSVKGVMAFQERKGLILGRGGSQRMVMFKAVSLDLIENFYALNMSKGITSNINDVYLGEMVARRLNLSVGDGLIIASPIDHGSGWGIPRQIQCVVGGIFNMQVLDLDDKIVFISDEIGKQLFIRKQGPDGMDIRLNENADVNAVATKIKSIIPNAKVETWGDLHSELFGAMKFERIGALVVLSFIIVVACFNLVTTLALVIAQKVREYGILQVIGMSQQMVRSIVLKQGIMIGGIGILSGVLIGLIFIVVQNIFGIIRIPEDIYFTPYLPMEIFLADIVIILAISVVMVVLSVIVAAQRALNMSVLEAIYLEK